jgi:hypothetical protein
MNVHCRDICDPNPATPLPPYPPFWTGGGTTPPIDPTILAVTCPTIPSTAVVNVATTIRVIGQNFTATCVAFLDNVAQATTFVSATELTFTATGTVAKTSTITVKDGATTAQGTCQFVWTAAPLLQITCPVAPISTICGTSPNIQITVNGANITATTVVLMDGNPIPSVYVSPTQIRGTVPSSTELVPRIAAIGLRDGAYTATLTCPFEFTQTVLVPTLTNIWPDVVGLSDVGKTVTYTGTNFDATSVVLRGGIVLPTTFVNATTLTTVTTAATATTGLFEMRVRNGPAGFYEVSTPSLQAQCVANPGLGQLVPPSVAAGTPGPFEVQLLGTNFTNISEILIDNVATPLRYVGGGNVKFDVNPAAYAPGTTVQILIHLGHQHPQGHDDVRPAVAPLTLPFQFT